MCAAFNQSVGWAICRGEERCLDALARPIPHRDRRTDRRARPAVSGGDQPRPALSPPPTSCFPITPRAALDETAKLRYVTLLNVLCDDNLEKRWCTRDYRTECNRSVAATSPPVPQLCTRWEPMAQDSTAQKGPRNRLAGIFEHIRRGGRENAISLLTQVAGREEYQTIFADVIEFIRDDQASRSVGPDRFRNFDEQSLRIELALAQSKISTLQWQLDFWQKHGKQSVEPKLKEYFERTSYLQRELSIARTKIRSYEQQVASLQGTYPTDSEYQNLRAENAKLALENTRLKERRREKDRRVAEWRREVEFLHEFVALLKGDPKTQTPNRNWPPPSWRPDVKDDEEPEEEDLLVIAMRTEIDQLKTQVKGLSAALPRGAKRD